MGLLILFMLLSLSATDLAAEGPSQEKVSVCISCHAELGGPMSEPVALWEKSIHHEMGNNCEGCHGGDPNDAAEAMNPERGFVGAPKPAQIPDFCGKCHVGVVENYKKSPHYRAFLNGNGPNCVTCHQSHNVQRASFDLIQEDLCGSCHSFENGQKIKRAFVSAEVALQEMKKELTHLNKRGMPIKKLEEKLFSERNSLHQMTHTLDVEEIQEKTRGALTSLETMKQETMLLRKKIHFRWWTGTAVGGFLIILIVFLVKLLKTFEE
ncbi:MAG: cytochrome c3 family protein [Deltaproteobacteria bacterium]|nr:cytochrome c3 family protein [Deltaproteobacteria bacterium]